MMERKGSLDGTTVIQSATAEEAVEFQVEGVDKSIGVFAQRSLGLALADERMGKSTGDPLKTFGHGGAGTSIGWADFDSGLAWAISPTASEAPSPTTPDWPPSPKPSATPASNINSDYKQRN